MRKILIGALVLFYSLIPVQVQGAEVNDKVSCSAVVQKCAPKSIDNFVGNFPNKIEIIFSDIDGTILKFNKENPRAEAPESVKKAVKKLENSHLPLVLATGRAYPEAREIAQKIGAGNSYIITQQGAEIRKNGKLIYQDNIKKSDVCSITDYFEGLKKSNNLTSKTVIFVSGRMYSTEKVKLPYNWAPITLVKSFKNIGNDFTSSMICIYETNPQKLRFIQSELRKHFPDYHIDLSTDCYCDVVNATATKGNAINKLSEILGIDMQYSAVLGDAENDISMLKQVKASGGASIAVGNAVNSVKESANYITSPVYEDGFAKAVDKILENNNLLININY